MKLRYWTAILAGALSLMTTALLLWSLTSLTIVPVVLLAMLAYLAAIAAVLAMTDRRPVERNTKHPEQQPAEFKIITLRAEDWA